MSTAVPQPCPEGTYQNPLIEVLESSGQCLDCPPGTYCGLGSVEPTECPTATYSELARSARCTECPVGLTTADRSTTALEGCVCKAGQYDRDATANETDCVE